jgi:NADH-quinone oxidoreductase subunit E
MASGGLSPDEQKQFDQGLAEILSHYPADRKSAAMLPALRLFQGLKGWLTPDGMRLVAERLGVSKERAYEVATFYVMFHTQRPGKYTVDVCTNLSCALRGAESLLAYLEKKLAVHAGETTERWTLRETECLASCGTAPCLQINEDHHESLTRESVDRIFDALT